MQTQIYIGKWNPQSLCFGITENCYPFAALISTAIIFNKPMVQLKLHFTQACRYTRVLAHLTCVKLQKLACAHTVARDFGVHTWDSKHTQNMIDTRHELALGLPHYTCGVTTGTVAVGNEMHLLCSWLASLYAVMNIAW